MDDEWLNNQRSIFKEFNIIKEQLTLLRIEVAMLKVKSGIWGLTGGLISVVSMLAIQFFMRK